MPELSSAVPENTGLIYHAYIGWILRYIKWKADLSKKRIMEEEIAEGEVGK